MQVGENIRGKSIMKNDDEGKKLKSLSENNDKVVDAINRFLL